MRAQVLESDGGLGPTSKFLVLKLVPYLKLQVILVGFKLVLIHIRCHISHINVTVET